MAELVVGFTGTRRGMTLRQRDEVGRQLVALCADRAVHGDCIGADEEFDGICKAHGVPVGVRPCTLQRMRAHCDSKQLAPPKAPMERNRDIVTDSGVLLAAPPGFERIRRGSGTWATIGFAERAGVRTIVVFPDGTVR